MTVIDIGRNKIIRLAAQIRTIQPSVKRSELGEMAIFAMTKWFASLGKTPELQKFEQAVKDGAAIIKEHVLKTTGRRRTEALFLLT